MSWNHNKIWGKHPAVTTGNDRTIGQRAADRMKMMLATWIALIGVLIGISVWMVYNSHISGHHAFDPYPWILLNLCLSCFAALQCFVLLIANKRGEQIAAEIAQSTYNNTQMVKKLLEENTELTKKVKHDTELLNEIHRHVSELGKGQFPPPAIVEEVPEIIPEVEVPAKPPRRRRTTKPKE